MFLTFTISSAMVSRHDEKAIKIHSEGGHPKNRQVLCFSPTYNYKLPAKKKTFRIHTGDVSLGSSLPATKKIT